MIVMLMSIILYFYLDIDNIVLIQLFRYIDIEHHFLAESEND